MNREYQLWRAQTYCAQLVPLYWPGHLDAWIANIEPWGTDYDDRPPELDQWRQEFDEWMRESLPDD